MQVPKLESDYGEDAARFLSQASGSGQRMTARIERKEKQQPQQGRGRDPLASQPLLHIILFKKGSDAVAESVNADLLRAGLARVKVPKHAKVGAMAKGCYDSARQLLLPFHSVYALSAVLLVQPSFCGLHCGTSAIAAYHSCLVCLSHLLSSGHATAMHMFTVLRSLHESVRTKRRADTCRGA